MSVQREPKGTDFKRAAEMLRAYVDSIKEHGWREMERWHYIPEVEEMAEELERLHSLDDKTHG